MSMNDEVVQKMKVTQTMVHDNYTASESDIALMKLNDSGNITKWVQLICVPSNDELSDEFLDGVRHTFGGPYRGEVAGWGRDASDRGTDVLTEVQLTVIPQQYRTVCGGDSGSPMVFPSHSLLKSQWVVEGIVSHIYKKSGQNCSNYEPGQYGSCLRLESVCPGLESNSVFKMSKRKNMSLCEKIVLLDTVKLQPQGTSQPCLVELLRGQKFTVARPVAQEQTLREKWSE
ncbi:unnamed protein product [Darwinula stevensoni]|uniref:Peptidase S1 domain-containing protein n=1 Tax=Darwinula stevensoni TaxID=69355 RepID=A0A7R9A6T5_9CRUS|nr:unnamed protein product [Darwinula stevensoni]CAG0895628.1 unnamed protein product [Darwinula stevensoni]